MANKMYSDTRLREIFANDPSYRFIAAVLLTAVDDLNSGYSRTPEINKAASEWFAKGNVGSITFRTCADLFGFEEGKLMAVLGIDPSAICPTNHIETARSDNGITNFAHNFSTM